MKVLTKVTNINKHSSTPFKRLVKKTFKKSGGSSEYSKATKLLPSAGDGQNKRTTLVHNAVIFPPYQPHGVKMLYKGKPDLTAEQEEVATMYAAMRDTDYMPKDRFKENFWNDWRKLLGRNHVIQNLKDCDFIPICDWYQSEKEKKKQMTTEFYPSIDDDVDEDIVIQDMALLLINFAANPKVDDDQPFIPSTPPTPPRPVDPEDLRVRVDVLQEQLHALQGELRIQAHDEQ